VHPVGLIKVLIIENSPLVRSVLTRALSSERDLWVVGAAKDAQEARDLIIVHRPDVIILDADLPGTSGLAFLKRLTVYYPVPVIICCEASPKGDEAALQATELGAAEVMAKPPHAQRELIRSLAIELADKVRAVAAAIRRPPILLSDAAAAPISLREAGLDPHRYLVAIGASTGGTDALQALLSQAPADFPPTVMVQHMPEGFTQAFAGRLNRHSHLTVTEAVHGDVLDAGRALLARGGIQMAVTTVGGRWQIAYGTSELVNRHCPSVDVLFNSVARAAGRRAIGVLLTGMGDDGARGLLHMAEAGALTIAQDRASSVVYGMPKVAAELGAVQHTAAPSQIPSLILQALRRRDAARPLAR